MAISLFTEDKLEYTFYPVTGHQVQFRVTARNDAHIALTTGPYEGEPMYEVFIGGWKNSKSVIRKNRSKPDVAEADTPDILTGDEPRGFWVRWNDTQITMGRENESEPILSHFESEPLNITHFGVCTGWGASGDWLIEAICIGGNDGYSNIPSAPMAVQGLETGKFCWCEAKDGMIPSGAVVGGNDEGDLYVGRARHEGAIIPGKVVPGHGVCYVAWGGTEHAKNEYEVLCECNPRWIPTSGNVIPPNAIPGGETEDGEALYVGRVNIENTMTIGKVQPSHESCYIPFGGNEVGFKDYEIMVSE